MKTTRAEVHQFLSRMGFKPHLKGYEYITELVMMMLSGELQYRLLCKFGYMKVGRKYRNTGANVERGVRHSIEVAYRNNPMLFISTFGFYERPSNLEFLACVTTHFKDLEDIATSVKRSYAG